MIAYGIQLRYVVTFAVRLFPNKAICHMYAVGHMFVLNTKGKSAVLVLRCYLGTLRSVNLACLSESHNLYYLHTRPVEGLFDKASLFVFVGLRYLPI